MDIVRILKKSWLHLCLYHHHSQSGLKLETSAIFYHQAPLKPSKNYTLRRQDLAQKSSDQSQGYLLSDLTLDDDMRTEISSYWDSDAETCLDWMQLIGCETENVVLVTGGALSDGHVLESISRAKMNLAIITIKTKGFGELYKELTEILW